jgi:hypothetical protein
VHQDHCQAICTNGFRLPIAKALHPAAVYRIDFDQLGHGRAEKRRSRQIITEDGLQVSIPQSLARLEWAQASLQEAGCIGVDFILGRVNAHAGSKVRIPMVLGMCTLGWPGEIGSFEPRAICNLQNLR